MTYSMSQVARERARQLPGWILWLRELLGRSAVRVAQQFTPIQSPVLMGFAGLRRVNSNAPAS
jgi:hypothetical protein